MQDTQRIEDAGRAERAQAASRSRAVPSDWFLDPADPAAGVRRGILPQRGAGGGGQPGDQRALGAGRGEGDHGLSVALRGAAGTGWGVNDNRVIWWESGGRAARRPLPRDRRARPTGGC